MERIGGPQGLQPQTPALVVHLQKEGEHIAHGQTQTDDLQERADQAGLRPAAGHAEKGQREKDGAEDGGRYPAALEAEGVEQGEAAEDACVDSDMDGDGACLHGGPPAKPD